MCIRGSVRGSDMLEGGYMLSCSVLCVRGRVVRGERRRRVRERVERKGTYHHHSRQGGHLSNTHSHAQNILPIGFPRFATTSM